MSFFSHNKSMSRKYVGKRMSLSSLEQDSLRGAKKQIATSLSFFYIFCLHRDMAFEAVKRLKDSPVVSLMNCFMIALAFVLPALFYLLVENIQQLGEGWDGNPNISLYLSTEVSQSEVAELRTKIAGFSFVEDVLYISPEEGLSIFQEQAGIRGVVSELGFNPLPAVLQLKVARGLSYDELDELVENFKKLTDVQQVRLDKKWVQRLLGIASLFKQASKVIAILLGLTIWLAISNAIGLSIEARKSEIKVVRLVGGTNGFIMLPFLYTGVIYGVLGACLALLIVWLVIITMMPPIVHLIGLYGGNYKVIGPDLYLFLTLIISGLLLGVIGGWVGCYRHLRNSSLF